MQYDEEKSKERLARIETKKVSKMLQNEYKMITRFLVMCLLMFILIVTMFIALTLTGNKTYQSVYIVSITLFMVSIVFVLNPLENKRFMKLDAHDRQFYILTLFKDNLMRDYNANKHQLWSLSNAF